MGMERHPWGIWGGGVHLGSCGGKQGGEVRRPKKNSKLGLVEAACKEEKRKKPWKASKAEPGRASREFYFRGHSLTGKTTILHIVISGSSPDVSNKFQRSRV